MRHGSRHGRHTGRLILAGCYIIYLTLYTLTLLAVPVEFNRPFLGSIFVTMLWLTVLFAAMWIGHNWARYAFMCLLVVTVVFTVPLLSDAADSGMDLPITVWALGAFHVVVLCTLIYSHAIHTLVRR